MEPTINAPIDAAAEALAAAAALPLTATGEETLVLVWDLARIARHLGELTAAVRNRWADWGTVTPHLQRAETLAADATRCLSHAAGTYVFNTAAFDTTQSGTNPSPSTTQPEVHHGRPRPVRH
ncbi:MAG: hypothetical protein ACRDRA_21655 [Pseudonocardiaceae bacterium]